MRLVIAKSICHREFGADAVPVEHVEVLRRSMAVELATPIKGEGLPPATRLLKVYATSPAGARRIVHLLVVPDDTLFLLFYRDKKDAIGANITIRNPQFRKQLHRHLDLLAADIESAEVEIWEVE